MDERAKTYPYAVLILQRELVKEKEWGTVEQIGNKAIRLLVTADSICYLTELLEIQILAKKNLGKTVEEDKLVRQYEAMKAICQKYGYADGIAGILTPIKKQFYLDREIIRKNRISRKMTQEKLSEGICEPETLARIEKGRKAHERNFIELTKKLDWRKGKRSTELAVWDFEKLEKQWKIDNLIGHRRYQEAKEELEAFSCEDTLEGKQYLLYMRTMVEVQLGEISYRDAREVFEEALSLALKNYKQICFEEYVLTQQEMIILNGIALTYAENGEKEKGVQLYKEILSGCENSCVKRQFRATAILIFMENLPLYLEELERYEEALEWHEKAICLELKCRRGLLLDRILTNKAYTLERKGEGYEACLQLYRQAYAISELMQDEVIGQIIKTHCYEQYKIEI